MRLSEIKKAHQNNRGLDLKINLKQSSYPPVDYFYSESFNWTQHFLNTNLGLSCRDVESIEVEYV